MKHGIIAAFAAFLALAFLTAGCGRDNKSGSELESTETPALVDKSDSPIADEEAEFADEAAAEKAEAPEPEATKADVEDGDDEELPSAWETPNPQSTEMTRERKAILDRSDKVFADNKEKYGNDANYFVARGLIADKAAREVKLEAYTTGVGPHDIAEFYLITPNSGHAYEALLVSVSTAADIANAVEFIGVPRGKGVDYKKLRFWPKGERVMATVSVDGAAPVSLDSMVLLEETGEPLSSNGFVFTADRRDESGAFAGDSAGPGSVISTYNEPVTLFDVPRKAAQSEVYTKYTITTNILKKQDVPAEVVLRPEVRPEGSPLRVKDVALAFSTNGVSVDGAASAPLKDVLGALQKAISEDRRDVHATLEWKEDMPLSAVADTCKVMSLLDIEGGVCVGPPAAGQPYYKAFTPNPELRDRASRYMQPCELRFAKDGSATLVAIAEIWKDDQLKPDLEVTEIADVTPDKLVRLLEENSPENSPSLLVFAPGAMEYGKLGQFISVLPARFFDVHVFLD